MEHLLCQSLGWIKWPKREPIMASSGCVNIKEKSIEHVRRDTDTESYRCLEVIKGNRQTESHLLEQCTFPAIKRTRTPDEF